MRKIYNIFTLYNSSVPKSFNFKLNNFCNYSLVYTTVVEKNFLLLLLRVLLSQHKDEFIVKKNQY